MLYFQMKRSMGRTKKQETLRIYCHFDKSDSHYSFQRTTCIKNNIHLFEEQKRIITKKKYKKKKLGFCWKMDIFLPITYFSISLTVGNNVINQLIKKQEITKLPRNKQTFSFAINFFVVVNGV